MDIKKHLKITGSSTVSWKDAIVKAISEASLIALTMASFQDTVELPVIFKCFFISILNLQKNFYKYFLQKVEKIYKNSRKYNEKII